MTKVELVAHKTSRIQGRLQRMRSGLCVDRSQFAGRIDLIEQVAFNMFLAMQEAVDMGSHIVADEGWGTPAALGETFTLLRDHGVISAETALAMKKGTRLRNLIAHAYGDVDPDKLFVAASAGLSQIGGFLAEVGTWVGQRLPPA